MEEAKNITELCEQLCASNLTMKGFSTLEGTSALFDLDRKGKTFKYPAWLIKDMDAGDFNTAGGPLDNQVVTFFLVDRVSKGKSVDDVKRAMKDQLKIVLARLFKIRANYDFLKNFNPKNAEYFGVGPITGDLYGMGCTFVISEAIEMIDKPEQWQD